MIAVTGATGFIGSHFVEEVVSRGLKVKCLVRKTSNLRWISELPVELIYGSLYDKESLIDFVKDSDIIFHIAGVISGFSEEDFIRGNYITTKNLIDTVKEINPSISQFIFVSSQSAAGPSIDGKPKREDDPSNPVSFYGRSKLFAENYVKNSGLPYTIVRPVSVYGPRDTGMFFLFKYAKSGIIPLIGSFEIFDMIHVKDLVKALILILENKKSLNQIYFVSDGNHYRLEDLGKKLSQTMKRDIRYVKVPLSVAKVYFGVVQTINKLKGHPSMVNKDKLREISHSKWICSIGKIKGELNFNPSVEIDYGLDETYRWYIESGWL
jgi:nucleoside-diphosphate-sugar epimerase